MPSQQLSEFRLSLLSPLPALQHYQDAIREHDSLAAAAQQLQQLQLETQQRAELSQQELASLKEELDSAQTRLASIEEDAAEAHVLRVQVAGLADTKARLQAEVRWELLHCTRVVTNWGKEPRLTVRCQQCSPAPPTRSPSNGTELGPHNTLLFSVGGDGCIWPRRGRTGC